MKVWPSKDPDETLKFSYDWAADLATGETLDHGASVFTTLVAVGTVIVGVETDDTTFTAAISGGNAGAEAQFQLRVTTSEGQVFEDIIALPIVASDALVPVDYPGGYVAPTPANLVALFPEFASVPGARLQYYLDRAARDVDESWTEGDFGHARMLLAAHKMTLGGFGSTAEAASVNDGSNQFRSMAIGSLRLERFGDGSGKSSSTYASTRYGREFKALLRANRGGPRVSGGVPAGWGDGDKAW